MPETDTFWNSSRDSYPRAPEEFLSEKSLRDIRNLTPFELGAKYVQTMFDGLDWKEAKSVLEEVPADLSEAREVFAESVKRNIQFQETLGLTACMREALESKDGPVPESFESGIKSAARSLFSAAAPKQEFEARDVEAKDIPPSIADPFTARSQFESSV